MTKPGNSRVLKVTLEEVLRDEEPEPGEYWLFQEELQTFFDTLEGEALVVSVIRRCIAIRGRHTRGRLTVILGR